MNNKVLALIDCNNFFVSCEKLFRPELEGRPVVVLSSNDGCVVARSNEAKALGIPMGAPAWQYRELFKTQGVTQFSANFELYGDISERIVNLLTTITPHIEVYSVDESFLDLSELDISDYDAWGRAVRASVLKHIGVPVSIGITPTKTLAKLAADRAKKEPKTGGVLSLLPTRNPAGLKIDTWKLVLASTPVEDIWGVGWKLAPRLRAEGVFTAFDLSQMNPKHAQQLMGIHGRQMLAELNGTVCIPLNRAQKPQQMIMRGRQFGEDTSEFYVLEAAIASLTARATAHLRREQQLARGAAVFIRTNKHKPGYRKLEASVTFTTPTADTGAICAALVDAASRVFNGHERYHRADVLLYDLVSDKALQTDLLGMVDIAEHDLESAKMQAVDTINLKHGKGTVRFAAENLSHAWQPRKNLMSPRYTSAWHELPILHIP